MYNRNKQANTSINRNTSYEGERIEEKINRIVNNNEPISDGAPLIFTERKEGVQPEYDIRTDRFEVAVEAMDKVTKSHKAKREAKILEMNKKDENKNGGAEPTQGTGESK
ncbi:MAG: hypothetical protein [Microviridae sp.]|nr:MAG: hypothetical protein [Microviridae sp.]